VLEHDIKQNLGKMIASCEFLLVLDMSEEINSALLKHVLNH